MRRPADKTMRNVIVRKVIVRGAFAVVFLLTGCVKRVEIIAILPDGAVSLVTGIEADPADAAKGDALPSAESGWSITDRIETDDEGKETLHRMASLHISAQQKLPSSYAVAGSNIEPHALWFPTQVTVDRRADGVYYHFRRVYVGRPFARIAFWRERIMETDEIKKITSESPESLSESDRKILASALVAFDSAKAIDLFDQAMESVSADVPQDAVLAARLAVRRVYDQEKLRTRMASLLAEADSGPEYEAMDAWLRDQAAEGVRAALQRESVAATAIEAVLGACADARRSFEITEDLGDEEWLVEVVMPGRIILHNNPNASEPGAINLEELARGAEDGLRPLVAELTATGFKHGFCEIDWTFDGKDLYDRDIILMATSFVPND